MIGADLDAARQLLADVVALNPYGSADAETAALCTDILQTIVALPFPGALVPVIDGVGGMQINVAAPTVATWRRLKPILLAFAGPTLTSFDGVPEPFHAGDALGACLMRAQPAVTAIMRLPVGKRARMSALRAVLRAQNTLARAPELQTSPPVSTSWLLACFQDHLNVGRRDAAAGVLERLRSELRLDALNVKFLEVQLLAAFEDWASIVALPEFPSLCVARRTPAITAILLEALYRTCLAPSFTTNDVDETLRRFETDVHPLAQSMILVPAPPSLGIGGWRIYALEMLLIPGRDDLLQVLAAARQDLGWLADMLPATGGTEAGEVVTATPLDTAREALIRADAIDSNDVLADAMAALARLSPEDLAVLHETMPFRAIVRQTDALSTGAPPTSWITWLERVSDPAFSNALDVARRGKDEWEIGVSAGDPIAVGALVNALNQVQGNDVAAERTTQALPYLVAWLQRDPEFPRAALSPLFSGLLTLFALGSARGTTIYESSQVLINALLSSGLDQKAYRDLIADVNEVAGEGFGVDMIYWVLEIVEAFMSAATPDAGARETFLHSILSRITPIQARLTQLQRLAVTLLSSELGWSMPTSAAAAAETAQFDESLANRMAGMRIAIYSLTESSSRQAKAALEHITPAVIVDTNADHGGTARLRALAENADLFVIMWLSAKHAATNFIRDHRGDRPLVFASGKGFSSVLRAIEGYFSGSTGPRAIPMVLKSAHDSAGS
jgi:hypothetical protein